MDVHERTAGERAELQRRINSEKNAKQRDRYRAAALAIDGREAEAIAQVLSRSRRFVQRPRPGGRRPRPDIEDPIPDLPEE